MSTTFELPPNACGEDLPQDWCSRITQSDGFIQPLDHLARGPCEVARCVSFRLRRDSRHGDTAPTENNRARWACRFAPRYAIKSAEWIPIMALERGAIAYCAISSPSPT